jgi:hypothetical protein
MKQHPRYFSFCKGICDATQGSEAGSSVYPFRSGIVATMIEFDLLMDWS